MLLGPPVALVVSLVGAVKDETKGFAVAGLVVSVGTILFWAALC